MTIPATRLQQMLPDAEFLGSRDVCVSRIESDSRRVSQGDVFVAVRGTRFDGHDFVDDAISRGAAAIVVDSRIESACVPQCVVPCSATAYARLCMMLTTGRPSGVTLAGITGTNGKTTTAFMVRSMLVSARLQTGILGTIETSDGVHVQPADMTTPSADILATHMLNMMKQQTSHCVVEISSHALIQKRCAGLSFAVGAITNITRDHLDYHGDNDSYRRAKLQIADLLHADAPLLLNLDDPGCLSLLDLIPPHVPVLTYGLNHKAAELRATVLSKTHRSQRVRLHLAQGDAEVRLRLIGTHNVQNALAAAGIAEQLGIQMPDIVTGLEQLHCVPGRLERIDEGQPFQVLVDYAHSPDALRHSINTLRDFVPGRVICVFGAGGDRDAGKRPLMGQVASDADFCIVTSDNPRNEDPEKILCEIEAGFTANMEYELIVDRQLAISRAFDAAEPGDVVLLAGKGHELTQDIGGIRHDFDDRETARRLLRAVKASHVRDLHPVFAANKSV